MPVNALLLTLNDSLEQRKSALEQLSNHSQIEVGQLEDRWLPVVAESNNTKNSHELHEWIEQLPGVNFVDIVFASVS
ncbi:hypothetical protein [Persicirhabdus sediminis]|uniref:Uncharacterized protein n=1 Tax=Persicirhabdus sediminis TaxID=454144 RepID=A0A8J7MEH2_9BACT|nr:hypothetical protein [Persicirhabdus sediminis]MBK1791811.1 hypothetical protein [Persicirhabdus sediminis]